MTIITTIAETKPKIDWTRAGAVALVRGDAWSC